MKMSKLFQAVLHDFATPNADGVEYFREEGWDIAPNGWPIGVEKFEQDSSWSYQAVDEENEDICEFEFDGAYMGEYEDRTEFVDKKDYDAFLLAFPDLKEHLEAMQAQNMAIIAEKNKQVAKLINEITDLAEEAGLSLSIDVGQHGTLDPYGSRWNSSMC